MAQNDGASPPHTRLSLPASSRSRLPHPHLLLVATFGTETVENAKIEAAVRDIFDLRPGAIVRDLDLRRPIYRETAAYGHFGRTGDGFTWELTNRADDLRSALGL